MGAISAGFGLSQRTLGLLTRGTVIRVLSVACSWAQGKVAEVSDNPLERRYSRAVQTGWSLNLKTPGGGLRDLLLE